MPRFNCDDIETIKATSMELVEESHLLIQVSREMRDKCRQNYSTLLERLRRSNNGADAGESQS